MQRARFNRLVQEALDTLPAKFRRKIENVAVVVEDLPPRPAAAGSPRPCSGQAGQGPGQKPDAQADLLMGVFEGVPATERSVWDLPQAPSRIVLYQKNIEAVCASEDEIREEVRLTVLHELGHYFGLTEDELEAV